MIAAALAPEIEIIAPWRDARFRNQFPDRAEMIAYCDDPAVTGVKFYLMSFVDGFRLTRTPEDPPKAARAACR